MIRRFFLLAGALALILCLTGPAAAGPSLPVPDMVEIRAPGWVGVGKPFPVRITTWYPLEGLTVRWNGKTVHPAVTWKDGRNEAVLLLGIGLRGETGTYPLEVEARIWGHERKFSRTVQVGESLWQEETLTVPPKMVDPPESERPRIERERELVNAAINTVSDERHWTYPFTLPVQGKMLSRFGLYRTFNGDVAGRHTGLDFRAWLGTPLKAIGAGRVVLTGGFYYAGNSVLIDHGNGLVTLSGHMSKVLVREGDRVEAGQVIGLSGATGRVTGAHLHLSVFVLGAVVDPEVLFQDDFYNTLE